MTQEIRTFNGQLYYCEKITASKTFAVEVKNNYKNYGFKARVIKLKKGIDDVFNNYGIFVN